MLRGRVNPVIRRLLVLLSLAFVASCGGDSPSVDPSEANFETFSGGYQTYPDIRPITWSSEEAGAAVYYHDRELNERFLSVVT